ncbi:uncharacterized protein [Canis lupus baileyi]|uniref:uncharacterized protein n=1 Tax=Canis lupus baileyi TaxID=143281 RepID=UPI003B96D90D
MATPPNSRFQAAMTSPFPFLPPRPPGPAALDPISRLLPPGCPRLSAPHQGPLLSPPQPRDCSSPSPPRGHSCPPPPHPGAGCSCPLFPPSRGRRRAGAARVPCWPRQLCLQRPRPSPSPQSGCAGAPWQRAQAQGRPSLQLRDPCHAGCPVGAAAGLAAGEAGAGRRQALLAAGAAACLAWEAPVASSSETGDHGRGPRRWLEGLEGLPSPCCCAHGHLAPSCSVVALSRPVLGHKLSTLVLSRQLNCMAVAWCGAQVPYGQSTGWSCLDHSLPSLRSELSPDQGRKCSWGERRTPMGASRPWACSGPLRCLLGASGVCSSPSPQGATMK